MKSIEGAVFAILASICFGFLGIFAKIGYDAGSNPTTVLLARFLLAAIILFAIIKISKVSLKVNKKQLLILFLMGVIGYTLTTQTLFLSYEYLGVGLATALHFVYPLCVCVFGFLFSKERFTKRKILALLVSVVGVAVLSASSPKGIDIRGVILALFSGVMYGGTVHFMGFESIKSLNGKVVTFYCSLFAGLATLVVGLISGDLITKINSHILISYVGISVISTLLALVFLLEAIKYVGAPSSAILGTLEPIVGIIASFIMFNEIIDFKTIIGMIAIVSSVILVATAKDKTSIEESVEGRTVNL